MLKSIQKIKQNTQTSLEPIRDVRFNLGGYSFRPAL